MIGQETEKPAPFSILSAFTHDPRTVQALLSVDDHRFLSNALRVF